METTSSIKHLARKIGVRLPATEQHIRCAFRKRVKDLGSGWMSTLEFRELRTVFDTLLEQEGQEEGFILPYVEKTEEGVLLSELGNGLGNDVNGKDCQDCHRAGFTTTRVENFVSHQCKKCDGSGRVPLKVKCPSCKGKKQFNLISGGEVDCERCHATGKIPHHTFKVWCWMCFTSGLVFQKDEEYPVHHFCHTCKGKGELLNANPVIPKYIGREIIADMQTAVAA